MSFFQNALADLQSYYGQVPHIEASIANTRWRFDAAFEAGGRIYAVEVKRMFRREIVDQILTNVLKAYDDFPVSIKVRFALIVCLPRNGLSEVECIKNRMAEVSFPVRVNFYDESNGLRVATIGRDE